MENNKSLYEFWVEFVSIILGKNAPQILYAFSFILFLILFFGTIFGVIKLVFSVLTLDNTQYFLALIGIWIVIIILLWFVFYLIFKLKSWFS